MSVLTNAQATEKIIDLAVLKGGYPTLKAFKLGFMGGAYVALAGFCYLLATHSLGKGLGKIVGSGLFPVALMFVVLVGGSLFTGDALVMFAVFEKKVGFWKFAKNLHAVWWGNFFGAFFIAMTTYFAGSFADINFAKLAVNVADHKMHLTATEAIFSGFLCNVLVAGAVWLAIATNSFSGKMLAIWFPICMFAFSGFQHVVANMYYLNIALMLDASVFHADKYVLHFIFVTIGNFISGAIFLPFMYKSIFMAKKH